MIKLIRFGDEVKKKGVTILELIIVIGIITIISGIVSLNFGDISKLEILDCVEYLKQDIRLVQRKAIAENCKYRILFNIEKNSYTVFKEDNFLFTKNLPKNIILEEIKPTSREFVYTKKGTPQMGGSIIIKNNNYKVKLTITLATGRVEIKEIEKI